MRKGKQRRLAILIGLLAVIVGLAATWFRYGPSSLPAGALPLLAGWAMAGSGLVAWVWQPRSLVGPLLAVAGLTTFVAPLESCWNLMPLSPRCLATGTLGGIAEQLAFLWTGFFAHALIGYPAGRSSTTLERLAITAAYVVALLPEVWQSDGGALLVTTFEAGLLLVAWASADRRLRTQRGPAVVASVGIWLTMLVVQAGGVAVVDPAVVMRVAVAFASVGLVARLVTSSRRGSAVADLVIDLGEARSGGVADALAVAIGDPTLEVAFAVDGATTFVDGGGRPVMLPRRGWLDRAVMTVDQDGRPVAVLITDPTVSIDPAVRTALAQAADLTATHAALEEELQARLAEVMSSRRRLVDAGVEERRDLEAQLHDGAEHSLAEVSGELEAAIATEVVPPEIAARIERAIEQLYVTRNDVRTLAGGLYPRILEELGLRGAMADLAERSIVPAELDLRGNLETDDVADATLYFVTSEALANAAKHGRARHVMISLTGSAGEVRLEVADDGVGGADERSGSGLRGLRDRVEALGGSFEIDSRSEQGTRLTATIPSACRVAAQP